MLTTHATAVEIPVGRELVAADLALPEHAFGLVIFAHGGGSGRHSPRNQAVAHELQRRGLGTLLSDPLAPAEEDVDRVTAQFDIDLLAGRLVRLVDWARERPDLGARRFGLFGASTGAAAALVAAAARPRDIVTVVSRGGRPDLAGAALPQVAAPTLLLVGSLDTEVISLNQWAKARMHCPVTWDIIHGASHLFEEPGTLEQVASRAGDWFVRYLGGAASGATRWAADTTTHPGTPPHATHTGLPRSRSRQRQRQLRTGS